MQKKLLCSWKDGGYSGWILDVPYKMLFSLEARLTNLMCRSTTDLNYCITCTHAHSLFLSYRFSLSLIRLTGHKTPAYLLMYTQAGRQAHTHTHRHTHTHTHTHTHCFSHIYTLSLSLSLSLSLTCTHTHCLKHLHDSMKLITCAYSYFFIAHTHNPRNTDLNITEWIFSIRVLYIFIVNQLLQHIRGQKIGIWLKSINAFTTICSATSSGWLEQTVCAFDKNTSYSTTINKSR